MGKPVPLTAELERLLSVPDGDRSAPVGCPNCGAGIPRIGTVETIYGTCELAVTWDDSGPDGSRSPTIPDGMVALDFGGYTKVDWDSSTSVAIVCLECGNELPESLQAQVFASLADETTRQTDPRDVLIQARLLATALQATFDGDSNDDEHDAAVELVQFLLDQ